MGIQPLPQTTVRALGANQVLTNPASVVKELVDNAVDASATSIAVEIHHNTIDTIQVRDNGRGVPPEDRPLVARRYCTSKITHNDDLKDIGGSSLGFRGEALASAAELSGSLTISTRIEGEQVAVALGIDKKGEVFGQDRASLPVGTTVKITDFIKFNPVRKQVALKNAESCLGKIKRMLQAYALARPHIRFSLRTLKSKTQKGDWVYAPKANSNAADAALKVVGSACATQCIWSVLEEGDFIFQAFLPGPKADARKIASAGCFISIDRRPVSNTRGTLKQIAKVFRDALRKASSNLEDVQDPFLYLEITCPMGSYDANIEPAKDDVLFEEPSLVVEGARKLFAAVYASVNVNSHEQTTSGNAKASAQLLDEEDASNFQVEKPFAVSVVPQSDVIDQSQGATSFPSREPWDEVDVPLDDEETRSQPRPRFRSNMYGYDEDDVHLITEPPADCEADMEELRQVRKNVNLSNPFIMAKLHGAVRRPAMEVLEPSSDSSALPNQLLSSPTKVTPRHVAPHEAFLPTPRPSSPLPPIEGPLSAWSTSMAMLPRPYLASPSHDAPRLQSPTDSDWRPAYDNVPDPGPQQHVTPAYNHALPAPTISTPSATPIDAIPTASTRTRQKPQGQPNVNKPFVPPFRAPENRDTVWFDFPESHSKRQRKPRAAQPDSGLVTQGQLGDLRNDPRPLTPPRRNRDIRAFLRSSEIVGAATPALDEGNVHQSTSSLIEQRNYARPPPDIDAQENRPNLENPPAHLRENGVLGGRDFVSAAEVAALQTYCSSSPEKHVPRPPKRRRTTERRALQELSTNAPHDEQHTPLDEQEYRPTTKTHRRNTLTGRRKSSRLPLESIPSRCSIANLVVTESTTPRNIAEMAGMIDDDNSLLSFNQPAVGLDSIFTNDELNLHDLSSRLHRLLIKSEANDSLMMGQQHLLLQEVRAAFAKHARVLAHDDEDGILSSAV